MDYTCPDCGRGEGEFHAPSCKQESCPKCHHNLMACGCRFAVVSKDESTFFDNKMKPYNRFPVKREINEDGGEDR